MSGSVRRIFSLVVSGKYIGTEQWFLDKEVPHQKDYLTKKPHSRFKLIHELHKTELEKKEDAEHEERMKRAEKRLMERLTKT